MGSKEGKLWNNQPSSIKTKNIEVWMDGSSLMGIRKQENEKITLLGFITCKTFNCKALRRELSKKGTMV